MELIIDRKKIEKAEAIEGYLSSNEGLFLYSLSRMSTPSSTIVEIGSWKGKSTTWLAQGLIDGRIDGRIVAIDHGAGDPEAGLEYTKDIFLKNIQEAGVASVIDPIFKKSEDAVSGWQKPIDLLFIDGAHDYQNVKKDFLWEEHLSDGGYLILHDGLNPYDGPAGLYIERVLKSGDFNNFGVVDSILFAKKAVNHNGNILRRKILAFLLKIWLFLTKIYKCLPKRGFRKKITRILMKDILRKVIGFFANYRLSVKLIII
jgi:predicted O-methyltransferase YrrM